MQTQAIIRETSTTTYTFAGVPSEATRKRLKASGYQFDGKTGQWYKVERKSAIVVESDVVEPIAA